MKSQINSKWDTKRKENHGLFFSILGTAVRVQSSMYLCFSESPYVCKCWKTHAVTVPAFLLVIVKDCGNIAW